MRLPRSPSDVLQVLSLAHAGVGLYLYRRPLAEVLDDKIVDAVPDWGDRATAFWCLTSAPLLWLTGRLLRSAEDGHDRTAQRAAGATLTATGLVGTAAMPRSGFPVLAAIGLGALRRSRTAGPRPGLPGD